MNVYLAAVAVWALALVAGAALVAAAGRKRPAPPLTDAQVRAEFDRILDRTWGPVR